jgi:hypothetical protein
MQLQGLSPRRQRQLILDELVRPDGSFENDEVRRAGANALIAIAEYDGDLAPDAIVRVFVCEYVFEVAITEFGPQLRDGTRSGDASKFDEEALRDFINATVDRADIPEQGNLRPSEFEDTIARTLGQVRRICGSGE